MKDEKPYSWKRDYKFNKETVDRICKHAVKRDQHAKTLLRLSLQDADIYADHTLMSSTALQIAFLEGKIQAHDQMMMLCQITIDDYVRLNND